MIQDDSTYTPLQGPYFRWQPPDDLQGFRDKLIEQVCDTCVHVELQEPRSDPLCLGEEELMLLRIGLGKVDVAEDGEREMSRGLVVDEGYETV